MMRSSVKFAFCVLLWFTSAAQATMVTTGEVIPGNPALWTSSTTVYVGKTVDGSLTIDDTEGAISNYGYLGYDLGVTGTVNVSGADSTWVNDDELHIGYFGSGALNISDGGAVTNYNKCHIAHAAGSTGTVNVSGLGATWTNSSSNLSVGYDGDGELNITAGGTVSNSSGCIAYSASASGTALVSGEGSAWNQGGQFLVGLGGEGDLTIADGGAVSNTIGYIGYSLGAIGAVTVTGTGSSWNNISQVCVGNHGSGQLRITSGGTVSCFDGYVGNEFNATGTVTVSGEEAVWNNSGHLWVSYFGDGSMSVTDGGAVNNSAGHIGYAAGTTGEVTISGTGSTWTNRNELYVGYSGNGILSIADGGEVRNSLNSRVGNFFGSTGMVSVSGIGSTWCNDNCNLTIGYEGDGQLDVTMGGTVESLNGCIAYAIDSSGVVTISGTGSKWTNRDLLYVGANGAGELNILGGGLVSVADSLSIDLDDNGDSFINMSTGGMLALAGQADSSLEGFLDLIEGTDAIRWWSAVLDDWAPLTTATMDVDYSLEYIPFAEEGEEENALAGYTLLTVGGEIVAVAGDANKDGRVDGSDVTILAGNWQHGVGMAEPDATWAMGDFNGDGKVDGSDVTILAGNWQHGVTSAASAVPEPGCVVMLLAALLAAGCFGYRRRSRGRFGS